MNAMHLLPEDRHHFSFGGSLTTPPCTEGVPWIVFEKPIQISVGQAEQFRSVIGENARPIQPDCGREIDEY